MNKYLSRLKYAIKTKTLKFELIKYRRNKDLKTKFEKVKRRIEKSSYLQDVFKQDKFSSTIQDNKKPKIFVFWYDGFIIAPSIVQLCYQSLVDKYSKNFLIVQIDKTNLEAISKIDSSLIDKFKKNKISVQMLSDILRFKLIYEYGGIWLDATIMLHDKSFDLTKFIDSYFNTTNNLINNKDVFTYKEYLTNWTGFFIYGKKGNNLAYYIYNMFLFYINKYHYYPYFLIDMFLMIAKINKLDNSLLNKFPSKDEDVFFVFNNRNKLVNEFTNLEKKFKIPQKLIWRIDIDNLNKDTILGKYILEIKEDIYKQDK